MRRFSLVIVVLLALVLVACAGDSDDSDSTQEPAPDQTPGSVPAGTLSPVYVHLQRDYETLLDSHRAISAIWEALAAGEQAQCGEYPDVLPPESISAEDDPAFETLADLLRRAAIGIEEAANLWRAECTYTRSNPPQDVINEGLLAVRGAGDLLEQAEQQLSGIQGTE
ncbi:MAG: hypothetical protein JXJ20_14505 [Anaerolineae bacterium]|nr:hypothetical protein [Anaerolineae bacterium]